MTPNLKWLLAILLVFLFPLFSQAKPPNVIIIMTDDQGYGDLSCHGNPILKTPHLDELHAESIRFTNFHVSPFCTPTRAALMTGRYPGKTGAYRTSSGRTMLHRDEETIAEVFSANGYATGMVGKWHLGDNAPHRPQDRGFDHVVWHRCGGIGQASDYWGNDYFDDVYEKNGTFEQFEGYCTDVWFEESMKFIESRRDEPFFLYLALNAPHGPFRVGKEWSDPYRAKIRWRGGPEFYGMVANFDHNVGRLREKLDKLELSEDTILIFLTDNGTSNGAVFGEDRLNSEARMGFNAGMRGKKSSVYEGGHRVPFFLHWPAGGMAGGRDVKALAAHLDVLPTLTDLCGFGGSERENIDGRSFASLLRDLERESHRDHLIIQFQGGAGFSEAPKAWEYTCIAQDQWRLINGADLYDLRDDPAQRNNIAGKHPEKVTELRSFYSAFWDEVSARMTPVSIDIGNPAENPTVLCSQDWYLPNGNPPWNFGSISRLPRVTGPWKVNVEKAGLYRLTLRQFPEEAGKPLMATRARIEIAGLEEESKVVEGSDGAVFEVELPEGKTELKTYLYDENGKAGGAYFTEVEAL